MIEPASIQIRFSDIDSMGHVNNAVYLSYFEYTRVHYFNKLLKPDWDWDSEGFILAHTDVSYLTPIQMKDDAKILMEIGQIGTKSFTLHYKIYVDSNLVTKGSSTLVCFNTKLQKSIVIPEEMKMSLNALQVFKP